MNSLSNITSTEFRTALTPERVRIGMFIQAFLAGGALIFFLAVLLVGMINQPNALYAIDLELLTTMTFACALFFLLTFIIGHFVYNMQFKSERLESAYSSDLKDKNGNIISASPAEKAVSLIRTSMLIRTALLEGSAFFGLAVLLVGAQQGAIISYSWIWINALPLLVLIIWVIVTFPTSSRLEKIFETKIIKS